MSERDSTFFIRCQFCGKQVVLNDRKDWESHTGHEWSAHIKRYHPEHVERGLVPYGVIEWTT